MLLLPPGPHVGFSPLGDDRLFPLGEFRALLQQHLHTMSEAWTGMAGRIAACEDSIEKDKQEKNNIYARISGNERKAADTTARVAKIEKELEEIKKGGGLSSAAGSPVPAPPGDPWASYRAKNGPAPGMPGPPAAAVS